ncbi:hypothetical protein AUEXF2481DRAFT_33862 [Aureobasidium subglaciale EXF-2481]|uniref:Uncharacterized protein n=1 Tax=Aureobasidium subglaciale (strain EXF-2481) TaxID=1043005 RepID=A0A074XYH9_AURSE|nr:uncharacterized protein AUEXF2481DRAFT_33862 [Aureobasidium subglaciale EXF-2481]KEQ90530.1 hypothetical protein AUEXF2481DRAFT_33862 [Aureobasidium subglaciale EXF-2481]
MHWFEKAIRLEDMPDHRDINAWMGHCGGTDPHCRQGCSPACANYTSMTGIESASKNHSADSVVEEPRAKAHNQPLVGQPAVQEAMRKVQEGRVALARTQNLLPQHQVRFDGRMPTTSGLLQPTDGTRPTASSTIASDDKSSAEDNTDMARHTLVSSTAEPVLEDEDEGAEYELDDLQRCC